MNDRIRFSEMERLTEGRTRPEQHAIEETVRRLNGAERTIRDGLRYLADEAARIGKYLTEGWMLDGPQLGRRVVDLDAAIVERDAAWQILGALLDAEDVTRLSARNATTRVVAEIPWGRFEDGGVGASLDEFLAVLTTGLHIKRETVANPGKNGDPVFEFRGSTAEITRLRGRLDDLSKLATVTADDLHEIAAAG